MAGIFFSVLQKPCNLSAAFPGGLCHEPLVAAPLRCVLCGCLEKLDKDVRSQDIFVLPRMPVLHPCPTGSAKTLTGLGKRPFLRRLSTRETGPPRPL